MIIRPNFNTIPDALKDRNQWVLWRMVNRGGKEVKLPWSVYNKAASTTDDSTWSSFECAVMRYDESYHAGVGFVFKAGGGLAGVDLDACRNPQVEQIADWALTYIEKANTYTEVSPSGTGVKMWLKTTKDFKGQNIKLDYPPIIPGGKKPGIEYYTHGRYFAVTGKVLKGFTR